MSKYPYLVHYNHNHDNLGRFTYSGHGNILKNINVDKSVKTYNTESEKFHLSDKQKKAIKIGAAVVGTALVAYGGYKLYQSGVLDDLINQGQKRVDSVLLGGSDVFRKGNINDLKGSSSSLYDPEKAKKISQELGFNLKEGVSDLPENLQINPGYKGGMSDPLRNNCAHSVIAWIMNEWGLDVKASRMEEDFIDSGVTPFEFKRYFNGCRFQSFANLPNSGTAEDYKKAMESAISQMCKKDNSDVAAGIWRATDYNAGGHYMGWKYENGKVLFVNPQIQSSNCDRWFENMSKGLIDLGNIDYSRLDNLEVNSKYIVKAVENKI